MRLLLVWLINAVALLALPYLMSSIRVDSFVTALVAALVLGLINTFIRPLLILLTLPATLDIQSAGQRAAPHISCIGSTRASIRDTLATYREHRIGHLVALRGDLPSGTADAGEFRFANELVEFIRETTGDAFHIDVACYPEYHPQAKSPAEDLASFKRKIEAGADSAITQ